MDEDELRSFLRRRLQGAESLSIRLDPAVFNSLKGKSWEISQIAREVTGEEWDVDLIYGRLVIEKRNTKHNDIRNAPVEIPKRGLRRRGRSID